MQFLEPVTAAAALAADYSLRGHEVTLIKTSHSMHDDNFNFLLENGGRMVMDEFGSESLCRIAHISRDLNAVCGQDVVLVCLADGLSPCAAPPPCSPALSGRFCSLTPATSPQPMCWAWCDKPEFIIAESESNFIDGAYRRLAASMWAFAT